MSTPRRLTSGPRSPGGRARSGFEGNARFELRRTLGEGGMGVVYEAYDREREMVVALKTVRELDAQGLYRLKTEFRARADLDHRNLVRLGELLHDEGHWFFTMELVEGWPFLEWVRLGAPLDLDDSTSGEAPVDEAAAAELRLREAMRQLASGLEALHRAGKVHRDLKPSNVMVTRKGRLVILDFGLVGESSPNQHSGGHDVVGTAAYMAPEQARSPAVSPAADCYSVGVMLYEALTGRLPFDGPPLEILVRKQTEDPPAPRGPRVPDDLGRLCSELLAIDPIDRPTAAAMAARLSTRATPEDRPPPFVGRARQLAELDAVLDEVAAGTTTTVFVEGESGIGKSALVRAFVERVLSHRRHALVLTGRCYERESVPFKGIDGIVDALTRDLLRRHPLDVALLLTPEVEALARIFPVLRRVPAIARLNVPRPASPVELRSRAFRGLRTLLASLGANHLLVVVVDDVQWADTDSLVVLREILHAPGAPRLLLVLTRRDVGPRPDLPGATRSIALGPLTPAEGRALIALVAPSRGADAEALVDDAGGHPMFLHELVRPTAAPPSRAGFDEAVWARVSRMDPRPRRALELVAIAGAPLPQGVVRQALGLEPSSFTKAIGVLRASSLVRTGGTRGSDPVEPYHDRVREAVLAHVPPARRRRYHERLAAVLLASSIADKDPLTVVRHLEAAGAVAHAAELAAAAARKADEALAFEQAAELWGAALRLGHLDEDARRDLLLRRAQALGYAGRGPDSADAFLAAAEGADPETKFQCRRLAAHELLVSGHVHEGLALLRSVLAEIGEHLPRTTGAALRQLVWRWARIALRGTAFTERAQPSGTAVLDHLRLDLMRTASLGLSMVDVLPGAAFQARAVLVALRLGDRRRVSYALAYHAMYLASSGVRVPAARRLVAQSREIAEACQSPFLLGWARCGLGITEFFAGNHALALEILDDAEVQLRDRSMGTSAELNHLRNFMLFALRRMGDYDQLRERVVEYLRDALRRGDRYAATTFAWSSNVVWLAADDVARARADLASVTWSPPERGLHLQHWFHVRAQLELALYEDDVAAMDALAPQIRAFLGPAFAHTEAVATETRYLLGRVAIRHGDAAGARRAVAPLRRVRVPYVRAFVRLVRAAAAALDARPDDARAELAGAVADAESCQMVALAAMARRRAAELATGADAARARDDADAVLAGRGVVDPPRFARVFATWPGSR